ncbi:hypothetical protein LJ737_04390 [Hymenobacter sp. 15J16-1T3B]|uniref:hypothetical protein n=1 Tax=Hymenobacter sp. 15J16-1T3B TaxID=2886941 RepID=UPI001D1021E5|nr:hypothetical protein [Hymenobacter sp. 15J16-1T3B]MCC3156462.1 hypothetical protein [Hymenobacter sp. 15J16-1T3B]
MSTPTIAIPVEALLPAAMPLLQPLIEAAARQLVGDNVADPQYSVPRAAEYLDVAPATVRAYTGLPEGHPRRLRTVSTSEHERGQRIRLSELRDWQARNDADALKAAAMPQPKRPARRRGHA